MSTRNRRLLLLAASGLVAVLVWLATGPALHVYRWRMHRVLADEVAVEYEHLKTRRPAAIEARRWDELCDLSLTARSNALFSPSTTPTGEYRTFVNHLRAVVRSPVAPTLRSIPDLWDAMARVSPAANRYRQNFRPLFDEQLAGAALASWAAELASLPLGGRAGSVTEGDAFRLLVESGPTAIPVIFAAYATERGAAGQVPWYLAVEEILEHHPVAPGGDEALRRETWRQWWQKTGRQKDWYPETRTPEWHESLDLP